MIDMPIDRPIRLFAPAKLNLGLEVVGRRDDGYHEIVTILQTISLFDVVILSPWSRFEFAGDPRVSATDDLALRAIRIFAARFGMSVRARVRIDKRIPVGGGLGGGSSDAGTMLAALCTLADIELSSGQSVAAELGSDVPFFVRGGTALATGTGTILEPLPAPRRQWYVLVVPDIQIQRKTASLYSSLRDDDFSPGDATRAIAAHLHRDQPFDPDLLRNTFARALYGIPAVEEARYRLIEVGARFVLPCGAGPSLFTMTNSWEEARAMARRLRNGGLTAIECSNVSADVNVSRLNWLKRG